MSNRSKARAVSVLRLAAAVALGVLSVGDRATAAGVFTDANFTGDANSGIAGDAVYTHAINFDFDDNLSINGAVFTGAGVGVAAPSTNNFTIAGPANTFGGNTNNLTGNSNALATNFSYNGQPEVVTLKNLRVGQSYVSTFYGVGFGPVGGRVVDITTSDGGAVTYDQNKAGDKNGNRLSYAFTATAPTQTFTITPRTTDTFHNYALTNQLVGYKSLLTDNFYLGPNNGDPGGPAFLNSNLPARQGGTLVTGAGGSNINYSVAGNAQVGNGPTGPVDRGNYLLTAFGASVSPDFNFNGSDPRVQANKPILISFDMAPNLGRNIDTTNWGAIDVGLAPDRRNVFVNDGGQHFGVLFRGNGFIQAFDGGTEITALGTGGGSARWYADDGVNNVTNALHHFELILSDPTATTIDVYADGNLISTFTKPGGFAAGGNNYINFVSSDIAGFDNVSVSQLAPVAVPEPTTLGLLGLGALALTTRRRPRT